MTKVMEALSGDHITANIGMGIYYDNPATVTGSDLRSDIGALVNATDAKKLNTKSTVYKFKTIPAATRAVVDFPYKNNLSYLI